jgi:hypothetical protein
VKFVHFRREKELVGTIAYEVQTGEIYYGATAVSDTEKQVSHATGRKKASERLRQALSGKESNWKPYYCEGQVVDIAKGMDYLYRQNNIKRLGKENSMAFTAKVKSIRELIEKLELVK